MVIVQLASLTSEKNVVKWLDEFMNKDKAGSRSKGRSRPFSTSTYYDFLLFHSLKSKTEIHSNGSVNFCRLQLYTPEVNESRLLW